MSAVSAAALAELLGALRAHHDAAVAADDPDADEVLDAAAAVADAFDHYDEALYEATGVETPLDIVDDDDELDDDEDELDEDEELDELDGEDDLSLDEDD